MTNVAIIRPELGVDARSIAVDRWQCCSHAPGTITHPNQLYGDDIHWLSNTAPTTAASALAASEQWNFEQPLDIDAFDWCFRATIEADVSQEVPAMLQFAGLAGEAEIWFNGQLIVTADNMFRSYRCDVADLLRTENELVCIFRSLKTKLAERRPRPRWKTNLVSQQQLRWHRTSLLGRIPGWAPCAPAVGPWRDVHLNCSPVQIEQLELRTHVDGSDGVIHIRGRLLSNEPIDTVWLRVAGSSYGLLAHDVEDGIEFAGEIQVQDVNLWWPHTHGDAALYDCTLLADSAGTQHELGQYKLGFRTLEVDRTEGFIVKVNGTPVFCRGACWTTSDLLARHATRDELESDLRLFRDAGANMVRIGGTMAYESESFYELCDELGILVWQDFMFANMDYPVDDPAFHENIVAEATEQLTRLGRYASVAIYCGSSEIEQQAAMLGMPREAWSNFWFRAELPALCSSLHPGTHYIPSTPTGGVLPFHTSEGVTHYYGVGAYRRPASDLRRANVKFTPECLGFANVPEAATCFEIMQGTSPVTHHPRWKARVPRDTGAGWDFEDVRDHYLGQLFGVDPIQLRASDMPRYLQLSRVASGEMMTVAFAEWRSCHSQNSGALVWFFKDIWPAAGWGIVDSHGTPKAAYYALKRSWNKRHVGLTDEGLNGLDIHLTNETCETISGSVQVVLLREPDTVVAECSVPVNIGRGSQVTLSADKILDRFYDVTYAYRFGPPHHDLVAVTWFDDQRQVIGEAFHFIERNMRPAMNNTGVDAQFDSLGNGQYEVAVTSDRFLHYVAIQAEGFLPDDNYFHIMPGRTKRVRFTPHSIDAASFAGDMTAVNLAAPLFVRPGDESEG